MPNEHLVVLVTAPMGAGEAELAKTLVRERLAACVNLVPAIRSFYFWEEKLEDDSEVFYQISEFYAPDASTGLRFDDPALGIDWPLAVTVMSDKDQVWRRSSARPCDLRRQLLLALPLAPWSSSRRLG